MRPPGQAAGQRRAGQPAASRPPLAGGLLAAGWPATDRKPCGRSLPVHFFSTLVVVGANQHDANHHAENEGQQEEYQDGLDV